MTLLSARGISKRYGGVQALAAVDFDIDRGQIIGLLGANGSGKSTLSAVLSGETRQTDGRVMVEGATLPGGVPRAARAAGIVIAHQHPGLAGDLPVWENVFLGAERCTRGGFIDRRAARSEAAQVLESLRSGWDLDALAASLSAADRQLVEIAKSIALKPRVLILDEPTASLAAPEVEALIGAVRSLAQKGAAIVFISHRMAEIEAMCDSVMVLCNGRSMGQLAVNGTLDEQRVIDMMGGANANGVNGTNDAATERHAPFDTRRTTTHVSGVSRPVRVIDRSRPPVLSVKALRAGHQIAGVDLALYPGEVLGIAGLQGHGQDALLDALAGFLPHDDGHVELDGARVVPRSPRQMIGRGICLVPNDRHRQGLWLDHSVDFNLAQVQVNFDRRGWRLSKGDLHALVQAAIARLGIKTSDARQPVRALSGGNQQKVVIGRWLDRDLRVLLLSDPTKGVDVMARRQIYDAIHDLARGGVSVLLYASDNEELLAECDRIIVLYEGRVAAELAGEAMNEAQITRASFGRSTA